MSETEKNQIGRNEPCPCGSGKKYKRCCGVSAAPKLGVVQPATGHGGPGGIDQEALSQMAGQMDQQQLMRMAQAFQRLPKGQLQRFQSLMQKAMSGKDITREASEFEATLPPDFQEMMKGFQLPASMLGGAGDAAPSSSEVAPSTTMSEDEARAIVAQAAEKGQISADEASKLLSQDSQGTETASKPEQSGGGISKLWKKFSGGNKTS